jgi:D-methionine transport system substrate-binding protein
MKKLLILLSLLALVVVGCGKKEETKPVEDATSKVIKVGATPVPHSEILNAIKEDLAAKGYTLEIVEFTDYVTPNIALNDGQIDANFFQHVPYMESFAKDKGLKLVSAGKVHVEPLGLYSQKFKSVEELPEGATIAIPNDPSNGGRALILLQSKGLIKLKADAGLDATEADIAENPKKIRIQST